MNIYIGFSFRYIRKIVSRMIVVAVVLFSVSTASAQTNAIRYSDYVNNTRTPSKSPLAVSNNVGLLIQLSTEISPAIYLSDSKSVGYGNGTPLVVYSDAQSIPMMYNQNDDFNAVELLVVSMNKPDDEKVTLVLKNLTSFINLKYVLLVYKYDSCGKNQDGCLKLKTDTMVMSVPGSTLTVLYSLSIPQ